jgi:hypothetical protein
MDVIPEEKRISIVLHGVLTGLSRERIIQYESASREISWSGSSLK